MHDVFADSISSSTVGVLWFVLISLSTGVVLSVRSDWVRAVESLRLGKCGGTGVGSAMVA